MQRRNSAEVIRFFPISCAIASVTNYNGVFRYRCRDRAPVAERLGIEFDHHNAGEDARAVGEILMPYNHRFR